MRAVYVVGAPGVGKSTAVDLAFPPLGEPERVGSLLWVERIERGLRLGRTRSEFGGTDALGMAVNPEAVVWAESAVLPALVVGEGARLATSTFLGALAERGDLRVVHLVADPRRLAERRADRTQDVAWQRGATTRADRIAAAFGATTLDTTDLDAPLVASVLRSLADEGVRSPR